VKAQILEKLVKGPLELSPILCLVLIRVIKVIAVCLMLTLVIWLVWLGKYTFGSFLGGAALGFFVFSILRFLKRNLTGPKATEGLSTTDEVSDLTDPDKIKPKASIND